MQNQIQSAIASGSFAAVRVFGTAAIDRRRFADEFQSAGFAPCLGFELPDRKTFASRVVNDAVSSGSVVVVEESSLTSLQSQLQFAAVDRSSLYLVVLAEGGTEAAFEEQAVGMQAGLSRDYRRVSVLPADVGEARLAREAAALIRADRMDAESALLWIIDDQPHRFHRGGCWADLAEAAQSSPGLGNRVRVVCSLVGRESLKNAERRTELVSVWREQILEPAARGGIRCVIVTSSELCAGDARVGEAWASTVLQRLPGSTAFIAGTAQFDSRRRPGEGIWISDDDRLASSDRKRILNALHGEEVRSGSPLPPPRTNPADVLSHAPVRAVALSSDAFRAAWPDLLLVEEPEILLRLHDALVREGPLDAAGRAALWTSLGWEATLAKGLENAPGALSTWVAAVPEPDHARIVDAWLAELTANPDDIEPPRERSSVNEDAAGDPGEESPPAQPSPSPPPGQQPFQRSVIQDVIGPSTRFTFLSVMDEWSSRRGGLSTFNREMCLALARTGHHVQCLVLDTDDAEIREAKRAGVDLLKCEQRPGEPPLMALHVPGDVPKKPDFILGHGRITGPAARQQERYYPGARRIHFFHMAPEVIEPLKSMARDATGDFAATARERMDVERELSRTAALAVAVGPRLHRELVTQLAAFRPCPRVYRLDPGITNSYDWQGREPLPAIWCLVSGRIEDFYLKGADIAAAALGRLADRAERYYKADLTLVVRGVEPGKDAATHQLLQKHFGPHLGEIRVRNYDSDREVLAGDLMQASLVLMPSREEGFGLVGLEAIAAGTPVLLTSRSGLAKLLQEAEPDIARHLIVDTSAYGHGNVERWADAIDSVLSDRVSAFERAARLRRGLASVYTWDRAARGLAEELARLAASG